MLRSKLTNRGRIECIPQAGLSVYPSPNGTNIEVLGMIPARVQDHRLAFNLQGFPPIEPAMGGIEPEEGAVCEGALVTLTRAEYEKVWASEGGTFSTPPYEEIIVQVEPLGNQGLGVVEAVTLRTAPFFRLPRDAQPSSRYLTLLQNGAQELGLSASYCDKLSSLRPARPSALVTKLARSTSTLNILLFRKGLIWTLKPLRWGLYKVEALAELHSLFWLPAEAISALLLLPGAVLGSGLRGVSRLTGQPLPSFGPSSPPQKPMPKAAAAAFVIPGQSKRCCDASPANSAQVRHRSMFGSPLMHHAGAVMILSCIWNRRRRSLGHRS
ncbi:unnamed protein product [Polarella glacialis]|uniref:Gamma-glutamylcyclotransferase n=1 Tax=Polarella glacialis TaxID=89957 RepID=A0A813GFD6_POLGL|nr:unnamed protein product [Polarella glacialis]